MTLLEATKTALRLKTTDEDIVSEITSLLYVALADLENTAGVDVGEITPTSDIGEDRLIEQAAITYVRVHFGEPDEYDRLKASYDEQKAQLRTIHRLAGED